jgi:Uma2 family endonuclease
MSTTAAKRRYIPEDLLTMPDGDHYELVDGELVERTAGWMSAWFGGQLLGSLFAYCSAKGLGWVMPATAGYQCFPDAPDKVRRPSASFVSFVRLPSEQEPEGHCPIAPDLVVEVVPYNGSYSDIRVKVAEYIRAGVRLAWVVNPPTRSVHVHRMDGTLAHLNETDELSGEDVVPGFRCRVGNLFITPS